MFKSSKALSNALIKTGQVTEENLLKVELDKGEYMLVDKTNVKQPLGYVSVTYMGIQPGRGKVFDVYARFA